MKSHILATNTPIWIDIPIRQLTNESKIRLKDARPISLKDTIPLKMRTQGKLNTLKKGIKMIVNPKLMNL